MAIRCPRTYYKGGAEQERDTDAKHRPEYDQAGQQNPIYYTMRTFGSQTRIRYWIFYGYQAPCVNVNNRLAQRRLERLSSRCRIASKALPGRAITDSSIAWVTRKREVSGSGSEAISFSKVVSVQPTKPSGAFLRTTLRRFFGSSPALASAFSFSMTCSGACATTKPAVSKPARPGPAGDLVELPGAQRPHAVAVVLRQRGEQHGADGHVDADTEGVRAADDLQQTGLGQLLHQPAVLGQHAGVVDADAVPDVTGRGCGRTWW